jgi:hypothetical protein
MARVDSENTTPIPVDPMRRRFLTRAAGVAAGSAALTIAAIPPALATAAPAGSPDPILAMIAVHKKLRAAVAEIYDRLDEAELDAVKEHGHRPIALIHWRNYHIGGSELDVRRETLLEAGEIDPAIIEQEYLDAKARYQAQIAAGPAWDERTGLAAFRKKFEQCYAAEQRYVKRLARTKPTTPAGTAALIQYVLDDDFSDDESYWHMTALRSAVAALNSMTGAVQS